MPQDDKESGRSTRSLAIVAGAVIVGMYLVWQWSMPSECEVIFRQTTTSLRADVDVLESLAGIGLSQENIELLSTRSEEIATGLRECCTKIEEEPFLRCQGSTEQFQNGLHELVKEAEQAKAAQQSGSPQLAQRHLAKARQRLKGLTTASDELVERFRQITSFTGHWEQEPNDQITDGTPVSLGTTTRGEILAAEDRDYFELIAPDGEPGQVRVILRKLAPEGMYASVTVYNEAEQKIGWSGILPGKDPATFAFASEPGTAYFVLAAPANEGTGPYELEVRGE